MKKNILLAGQWVGEFGWELFCWQGYIRQLSKHYDEVIIVGRSDNQFLYEDFCDKYIELESPSTKANMWLGNTNENMMTQIVRDYKPTHHVKPFNIGYSPIGEYANLIKGNFGKQDFIKFKSNTVKKKYDVILHCRNKFVGSNRNWDKTKWMKLISLLKEKYSIATIGSNEAYGFDGIDDYRNIPIKDTVSLMNRCKIVVGQSSGPMHLASLCGAKHLVWSDNSNYKRYTQHWNPFNTEVIFYDNDNWNPSVKTIYDLIVNNI